MSAYQLNIVTDDDSRLGYETNGPVRKVFNVILTPILNNIPSIWREFIKKTHHSAKKVIEKATTHEAIEVLYKNGEPEKAKKFDKNKSVLKDIYITFSVNDPGELQELYMTEDQTLMRTAQWDYNNQNLITNRIKSMIEKVGISNIANRKERQWIQNILWMWYHHAITCALWLYGDKSAAQKYSKQALDIQTAGHPNKITRLLYLLTRDNIKEAEQWAKEITEEPEKTTAQYNLELYKKGDFFKPQL